MSSFESTFVFAPVSSAFVEMVPAALVGLFIYDFAAGPQDPIYIRPGNLGQQDFLNADGAEWLLYSRSVLYYQIEVGDIGEPLGGASLIVEIGNQTAAGVPAMREWRVFHLVPGIQIWSCMAGIELPGLMARFTIRTASAALGIAVNGSIIVRGV